MWQINISVPNMLLISLEITCQNELKGERALY